LNATLWLTVGGIALFFGSVLSTLAHSARRASRSRLESFASGRSLERARAVLDDPEGHEAALSAPRAVCHLAAGVALVEWVAVSRAGGGAAGAGVVPDWIDLGAGVGIAALCVWLLGMVIPSAIAEHAGERVVASMSGPMRLWHSVSSPPRALARLIHEIVRRLAGVEVRSGADEIGAEILSVVEEGERGGALDETERDMIEAVVEFRSTTAEQIMTPRTEIEALEATDDLDAVMLFIDEHGHSRVPVYEGNLDTIVGILYAKDLIRWQVTHKGNGARFRLKDNLRPAVFVPETKTVRELLAELLAAKVHIAMIADEYGGTSGLVTIEDIVEEVFGEIQDEYESDEDLVEIRVDEASGSATIDARADLDDANDALETLEIELPESEDYDTVGGFVVVTLGRIPDPGERLELEGVVVSVLEAESTRVVRVRVERAPEPADTEPPGK